MSIVWKGFADTPDTPGDYWHDTFVQDMLARLPDWFDPNILVTPGHFRDATPVNEFISDKPWIVFILGDEEGDCPFWDVNAPVWKQFPNPHRPYWPDRVLPLGYTPHTRPALRGLGVPLEKSGWVLTGQDTNERRHQAFAALSLIDPKRIHPSPTFAGGHAPADYIRQLWEVEWAPSPAGNVRADSFRMWEALEAGAVPILDHTTPHHDRNVWNEMIGDHPFPVMKNWHSVDSVLAEPAPMTTAAVWYSQYKRRLTDQLIADWAELTGEQPWDPPSVRIRTIITASPLPSHPDFDILAETVESVRARLPNPILIAFDGPRDSDNRAVYEEHIRRVAYHANLHWPEVTLWYTGEWKHQAGTLKDVLPETGTVLVLEADTPLTGEIPWDDLVTWLYTGEFNHIRLHYDTEIHPDHKYLLRGESRRPVLRTVQYSQRPHLALASYYRDLLTVVPDEARTYVEDCVYGPIAGSPWENNKLGIYAPEPNMQRSYHLDGRAGIPKGEFWW